MGIRSRPTSALSRFRLLDLSYRNYGDVSLSAGSLTYLRNLFQGASSSFKDILIFGDSQETTPGGSGGVFIPALNLEAFKRYGAPSKTPWYQPVSFDSSATFCIGSTIAGAALEVETNEHPPKARLVRTTTGSNGPLFCLFPDGGSNTTLTDFGGTYFPADTGTINYELIAVTDSSSPPQIRIRQETNVNSIAYFGTVENDFIYSTTDMSATDGDRIKISVGPLVHSVARPFINVFSNGWTGSATAPNHFMQVGRFVDTSRNQGMTFTTWSAGGQTIQSLLTKINIGDTTQAAGSWDLVICTLGTNHGSIVDPALQKTRYLDLINQIRLWTGNLEQPILLLSEPPRNTFSSVNALNMFNAQGAIMGELATEEENISFINFGRHLLKKYPDFGVASGIYLSDTVHLTNEAQALAASELFVLLDAL